MNLVKEKWYYNEVIVCTGIVLGIFGLMFLLIKLGVDVKTSAIIGGCIFFGVILLPLIDPIRDGIKWIKSHRQSNKSDYTSSKEDRSQ